MGDRAGLAALAGQFFKFGIVGTIGFLVDWGVLEAATGLLDFGPYGGRVLSFLAAATVTWALNRAFTFRGAGGGPAHRQYAVFVLAMVAGFAVNYGTYSLCIAWLPLFREHLGLAVAAGSIAGLGINFVSSKWLVFRG